MPASAAIPSTTSQVVVGKILHKETASGVPDLLVDLFDLDAWADPEFPIIFLAHSVQARGA